MKELDELLKAATRFWRYVNEYSDPVEDEPRVVRFRKACRAARKKLKQAKK